MRKALKAALNVVGHRKIDKAILVVPRKFDATIASAFPIGGTTVVLAQRSDEGFGIRTLSVADTKVIDNKGKDQVGVVVAPKARRDGLGTVTMGSKTFDKLVIGDLASLGKAVHALTDFKVDESIVNKFGDVIHIPDAFGNKFDGDAHVFVSSHRCFEVEITEINEHETAIRRGDDTVEQAFSSSEISSACGGDTRIVDAVAASGETDTPRLGLLRAPSAHDA